MYYLFILESIGTSELLLIGLVALIVFGPRKLPEFARMLGKARNEFKKTTDDFKRTWEREVDFENLERQDAPDLNTMNTISKNSLPASETALKNEIVVPEIKEVSQAEFETMSAKKESVVSATTEINDADKRHWL